MYATLTRRRLALCAALWPCAHRVRAQPSDLRAALARAHALRDEAVRAGDQPYGAVVWIDGRIVGEAPSRVITSGSIDAHAEREALRDAQRQLQKQDLAGALLVSTSRPCALCESAAARAGIARMVFGDGQDAGPPQLR